MRMLAIAVLSLCATSVLAQTPATPLYEVYAIRYATMNFPVAGLVKGADPARKTDIAMMVWLIRGGGRNILVDTGFYRQPLVDRWKPADFVRPDEAVARAGVRPDERARMGERTKGCR